MPQAMPQRYFFRLVHAESVIEDPLGVIAASLDQARSEALAAIEELKATTELSNCTDQWCLEIRDEAGEFLQSISLG